MDIAIGKSVATLARMISMHWFMEMSDCSGIEDCIDEADKMSVGYSLLGFVYEGWVKKAEGCS